jgi:hypothetical protein
MGAIVLEMDTGTGGEVFFPPAQKKLRGRIVINNLRDEQARVHPEFKDLDIPGQRLHFDPETKKAHIEETLYSDLHRRAREAICRRWTLAPITTDIKSDIDKPTWLYWLKRLVECGYARVVHGALPDKIEGKPQLQFLTVEPQGKSEAEQKTERLASLLEKLAVVMVASLPEAKRREAEALLKG